MPAITGVTGSATITAGQLWEELVVNVGNWSADIVMDEHNADVFSDSNEGHVVIPGMYQMRGTITGFLDDTAPLEIASMAPDRAATTSLILTSSTGRIYTFVAHIFNVNLGVGKNAGLNTYTATFASTGVITTIV